MKKFLVFVFSFLCITQVAFADISQFVFITPIQTVLPNTLSGPITLQAKNSSGTQESTAETTDLVFTSTSPTGQFLSSTGKVVSKTMAKGTANRTFYYSDSTLGTYTLTVIATGRTSKQTFSASQQITIGSSTPKIVHPVLLPPIQTPPPSSGQKTPSSSKKSNTNVPTISDTTLAPPPQTDVQNQNTSTTNTATVYEGTPKTSVFDSIFDWPGIVWNWLVHIF